MCLSRISSCSPRAAKGGSSPSSSSVSPFLKPCTRSEELYPDTFEMLFCLGPQVYLDPPLLAKVLRVGRAFLKGRAASKNNGELPSEEREEVYHGFLTTLDEVVLPALSLMPCNCGMAEETWAMVKQLPYETRLVEYLLLPPLSPLCLSPHPSHSVQIISVDHSLL